MNYHDVGKEGRQWETPRGQQRGGEGYGGTGRGFAAAGCLRGPILIAENPGFLQTAGAALGLAKTRKKVTMTKEMEKKWKKEKKRKKKKKRRKEEEKKDKSLL